MPFLSTSGHAMERMRDDLLRRARSERQQRDLEQGPFQQSEREMTETRQNHTGSTAPRLFGEIPREEVSTSDMPREMNMLPMEEVESPKSPDSTGGRRATRFTLPRMSRIWSRGPPREQTQETMDPAIESQLPLADRDNWAIPSPPQPATHPHSTIRAASSYYSETEGPDTASIRPSSRETDEDRRRRRRGRQRRERGRDGRRKRRGKPPQRFLYCFPWVKSKRMRAYIVRCFVSGLFLVILLTVCKSLHLSRRRDALTIHRPRAVRKQPDQHGRIHHRSYSDRHSGNSVLLLWSHQALHACDEKRPSSRTARCRRTRWPRLCCTG